MSEDAFTAAQIAAADQIHAAATRQLDEVLAAVRQDHVRHRAAGLDMGEAGSVGVLAAKLRKRGLAYPPECSIESMSLLIAAAVYRLAVAPETLAERMLAAADTVAEVSRLYEAFDADKYEWSAERLRIEAVLVAAEAAES